jgi:hypothetical protein
MTNPKRPRDPNQLAKLIADIATGEVTETKTDDGKDPAAVALGRKGGLKGGAARAKKLTAEKRSEIAKKAAVTRWKTREQALPSSGFREEPRKAKKVRAKIPSPEA